MSWLDIKLKLITPTYDGSTSENIKQYDTDLHCPNGR